MTDKPLSERMNGDGGHAVLYAQKVADLEHRLAAAEARVEELTGKLEQALAEPEAAFIEKWGCSMVLREFIAARRTKLDGDKVMDKFTSKLATGYDECDSIIGPDGKTMDTEDVVALLNRAEQPAPTTGEQQGRHGHSNEEIEFARHEAVSIQEDKKPVSYQRIDTTVESLRKLARKFAARSQRVGEGSAAAQAEVMRCADDLHDLADNLTLAALTREEGK